MSELYASLESLLQWRFHVKQRKLSAQQKIQATLGGNHHAIRKGRGMEFSEVRPYQPGDDIRHIDWRVSARTQTVHTKLFSEELERPIIGVIEQTPNLFFGTQVRFKNVQALNLLAILGWATLNHHDRFGCLAFNQHKGYWIEPKHRPRTLMQILHQALELQQQLTQPKALAQDVWLPQLQQLPKYLRPGAKIFLIGDLLSWQASHFAQLQTLKRHHDLTAIHLYDTLEAELPKLGLVKFANGHQEVQINAQDQRLRQGYQSAYQTQIDQLQSQLHRLKIPLAQISAQAHPLEALQQQGIMQ